MQARTLRRMSVSCTVGENWRRQRIKELDEDNSRVVSVPQTVTKFLYIKVLLALQINEAGALETQEIVQCLTCRKSRRGAVGVEVKDGRVYSFPSRLGDG